MCRFVAAILSVVFLAFSSITCIYGLFSMQWYTGTGISIGIPTGCQNVTTVGNGTSTTSYCSNLTWASLDGSAEQAMAVLLMIAFAFGVIAVVLLFVSILFACCCLGATGPAVAGLGGLQSIMIAAVCLIMSAHYGWKNPAGTTMGPAYVLAIVGSVCAMVGAVLAQLHHKRAGTHEKVVGAV